MDGFNTLFMNNDLFSKTFLGKISFYKGCSAFQKNIIFQRLFTSCTQMNLVAVLTFDGFVSQLENWETQPASIPQQRKFNICPKFDSWMGVYDWTSLPNFPNTAFRFWSKLWIKRDGRSRAFFYGAGVKIHGTGQIKRFKLIFRPNCESRSPQVLSISSGQGKACFSWRGSPF